jgi:DNA-binding MarR family transcriptional regulator
MNAGGKRGSQQRCVCVTLRKATRCVTQFYDNALRPSGIRATQFHILSEIRAAGEATITELTKLLVIDQTTLTRSVALLERDGLLTSVPKSDGRLKPVRLTKKGEQAIVKAHPLWTAAQKHMIGSIGPRAWALLSAELERLAQEPNF